jgi:tetratricopeptide (TPR) repeat protein
LLGVVLLSSLALAADDEALTHFKAGKAAFRAGELAEKLGQRDEAQRKYRAAVDELKRAYELQPQPVMLWGLGEAFRALGEIQPALEAYRHYLAEVPPSTKPNFRAEAQAHVDKLERAAAATNVAAAPPRSVTPPEGGATPAPSSLTPPASDRTLRAEPRADARPAGIASATLLGLAVVALGAGGGVLGHALSINPDERGITIDERAQRTDTRNTEQAAGIGVLAVGGAALVGSAIAFGVWMSRKREPRAPVALIAPVAGGALLTLGGGF